MTITAPAPTRTHTRGIGPRTAAVIEDAGFLASPWGGSCGLTHTAHRLGYTSPASLERALYRAGRYDLVVALRGNETTNPTRQHTRY